MNEKEIEPVSENTKPEGNNENGKPGDSVIGNTEPQQSNWDNLGAPSDVEPEKRRGGDTSNNSSTGNP